MIPVYDIAYAACRVEYCNAVFDLLWRVFNIAYYFDLMILHWLPKLCFAFFWVRKVASTSDVIRVLGSDQPLEAEMCDLSERPSFSTFLTPVSSLFFDNQTRRLLQFRDVAAFPETYAESEDLAVSQLFPRGFATECRVWPCALFLEWNAVSFVLINPRSTLSPLAFYALPQY